MPAVNRPTAPRFIRRCPGACLLAVSLGAGAPAISFAAGSMDSGDGRYCEFTPAAKTDRFVPGLIVGAEVLLPEEDTNFASLHTKISLKGLY